MPRIHTTWSSSLQRTSGIWHNKYHGPLHPGRRSPQGAPAPGAAPPKRLAWRCTLSCCRPAFLPSLPSASHIPTPSFTSQVHYLYLSLRLGGIWPQQLGHSRLSPEGVNPGLLGLSRPALLPRCTACWESTCSSLGTLFPPLSAKAF